MSTPCPDCGRPGAMTEDGFPCCEAEHLRVACLAYALPDKPWIPKEQREAPCVFCGVPRHEHRPMPELPEDP